MTFVEIRDHVLWAKHIHGSNNAALNARIENLAEGELIKLTVDGVTGMWCGMDDGSDGWPTPGIKPIGVARKHWQGLQDQRGEIVEIAVAEKFDSDFRGALVRGGHTVITEGETGYEQPRNAEGAGDRREGAGPVTKKKEVCPECGYVFKGNGWEGIDAHWRSKHEHVMTYTNAWPLIRNGQWAAMRERFKKSTL